MFKVLFVFMFAIAALGALQSPAHAANPRRPSHAAASITVSFADLDLATEAGVTTLMRRVGRAADKVCGGRPPSFAHIEERRAFRACRTLAIGPVAAVFEPWRAPVQWASASARIAG